MIMSVEIETAVNSKNLRASELVKAIRLLIVDDHEMVGHGLALLLNEFDTFDVLAHVKSGDDALRFLGENTVDVILLDIMLPGKNGFEICQDIRNLGIGTPILFLTSFNEEDTILKVVNSGGNGFVLKEIGIEALKQAIIKTSKGETFLDPSVADKVFSCIKTLNSSPKEKLSHLSPQESRALRLVARGMTNKEIAVAMTLSENTVKNYIRNLLDKLGFNRRSQAAAFFAHYEGLE
jgi:two-component system, NarL family, response regulator DevR